MALKYIQVMATTTLIPIPAAMNSVGEVAISWQFFRDSWQNYEYATEWDWLPQNEDAFHQIKIMLASSNTEILQCRQLDHCAMRHELI